MKSSAKLATVGMFAVLMAAGCAGPAKSGKATAPAPAPATANILSGKVLETMDGGGYTYINLESNGKKTWAAVPATKVAVGQEIKLLGGAEMHNFPSKALNRTFDSIIFSGGVYDPAKSAAEAKKKAAVKYAAKTITAGKVAETMNAGTYTYLRIEKDGESSWAAIPAVKIKVGDEVELLPGTEMGQFSSPSLNRTFPNIYFASGLKKGGEEAAAPAAPAAAAAGEDKGKAADGQAQALPAGHPKMDGAAAPAAAPSMPTPAVAKGKVVETMDSGSYTYICLEKDGKKTWAAIPATKVKVGQEVAIAPGMTMPNFTSKSLNRTFDKIIFSTGLAQ